MKQITLSLLVVMAVLFFQNCKKSSSSDDTTTATPVLSATINNTIWEPDTLSANITYTAASKTKVFNFTGTSGQKRLTCSVTTTSATNTNTFATGAYPVDAIGNTVMIYSAQKKDTNGNYVFVQVVAAAAGDGSINISDVEPASGTITGTFYFTHKITNYDSTGAVISVSNTVISGGAFTSMPYTFISN
jgi:hypothetical protein